jgi:hypothetical protein
VMREEDGEVVRGKDATLASAPGGIILRLGRDPGELGADFTTLSRKKRVKPAPSSPSSLPLLSRFYTKYRAT